jgi:hypothetical protein
MISPFPSTQLRAAFIQGSNQQAQKLSDMLGVPTDRLLITSPDSESQLLKETPNLIAVAPRFVNHSALPVCHTLFFVPSPDTLAFSNLTLHLAKVPPNLLAPLPLPTFLQASGPSPQATHVLQPQVETTILQTIFTQWDQTTPATSIPAPKPSRKRTKTTSPASTPEASQDATPTPDASQDTTPPTQNYYASLELEDSDATHSSSASTLVGNTPKDFLDLDSASNSSHSSMDEDAFDFPPDMSQATCAQYRKIQFFVESNLPDRLDDYYSNLRRTIIHNKDPAALAKKVRRWFDQSI